MITHKRLKRVTKGRIVKKARVAARTTKPRPEEKRPAPKPKLRPKRNVPKKAPRLAPKRASRKAPARGPGKFDEATAKKKTKKEFEIVIARCSEGNPGVNYGSSKAFWLPDYMRRFATVYNKGKDNIDPSFTCVRSLPNVGRESHTYLKHIIDNYDNLADVTWFVQGSLTGHWSQLAFFNKYWNPGVNGKFRSKIKKVLLKWGMRPGLDRHIGKHRQARNSGTMRRAKMNFRNFFNKYVKAKLPKNYRQFKWVSGAIFSADRKHIHKRPKAYYETLIELLNDHVNPEEGHYFERSWYYIMKGYEK